MSATYFREYLSLGEEKKLLATVAATAGLLAERDHAWMLTLRHTGCRIDAFSRLTVAHAEAVLKTGYLTLEPGIMKRNKGHTLYVSKPGRMAFKALLSVRRRMRFAHDPDGPLVMSRNHDPMSVRSYQARLRYWDSKAGLDLGLSPHWFRHTFAKRLMAASESQNPVLIVMAALGHTDIRSTLQYTWPDKEVMELELENAA